MNIFKKLSLGVLFLFFSFIILGAMVPINTVKADVTLDRDPPEYVVPGQAVLTVNEGFNGYCYPSPDYLMGGSGVKITSTDGTVHDFEVGGGGYAQGTMTVPVTLYGDHYITIKKVLNCYQQEHSGSLTWQMAVVGVTGGGGGSAPTITTPTATSITSTSAIVGANITSIGSPAPLLSRGACVGTTGSPSGCAIEGGTGTGVFSYLRTGLTPGTTYNLYGYATNATGIGYTTHSSFTTTLVSLTKDPAKVKNLVKKSSSDAIGKAHLLIYVNGLLSGSCKLKNNGVDTDGISYGNNPITLSKDISGLQNDSNDFQLQCTDGALTKSLPLVNVQGQSGTLTGGYSSCTIASGQSSCQIPISWTTTNWKNGNNTFVGGTPVTTGTSGTMVTTTIPGSNIPVDGITGTATLTSRNVVDGENNTVANPTTQINDLASITITTSCSQTPVATSWNGTICAPAQTHNSDLVPGAVTPTSGIVGETLNLTALITNIGSDSTGQDFYGYIQLAGPAPDYTPQDLSPELIGALASGGHGSIVTPHQFAKAGTYYVRAWADRSYLSDPGLIQELREDNNGGTGGTGAWTEVIIYSNSYPDLVASTVSPKTFTPGVPVTYSATITNQGTVATPTGFTNLFQTAEYFDDANAPVNVRDFKNDNNMRALAAGASDSTSATITLVKTDRYIRACADKSSQSDAYGVIDEGPNHMGEYNNCSSAWILLDPLPDLIAGTAYTNPAIKIVAGDRVRLISAIQNTSKISTKRNFYNFFQVTASDPNGNGLSYSNHKSNFLSSLFFQVAEAQVCYGQNIIDLPAVLMTALDGGTKADTTASYSFDKDGTYWIRACADKSSSGDTGLIVESSETNNCGTWVPVVVGAVPVNGVCNCTHYECQAGISSHNYEGPTAYTWNCDGINGGKTVSCSEDKNTMYGTLTPEKPSCLISEGKNSCLIGFTWLVTNPEAPKTSTVTNGNGKIVGTGDAGTDKFDVVYPADIFSLENNGTPLANSVVLATCGTGLVWDDKGGTCIKVPTAPDLTAVAPVTFNSTVAGKISITGTIINQGTASTGISFWNFFQVSTTDQNGGGIQQLETLKTKKKSFFSSLFQKVFAGTSVGTGGITGNTPGGDITDLDPVLMNPLGAGKSDTTTQTYTFTEGMYWVRVCADLKNSKETVGLIAESNETNNCSSPWTVVTITTTGTGTTGVCSSPAKHYTCGNAASAENKHETPANWTWTCPSLDEGPDSPTCTQLKKKPGFTEN